MKGIWMLSRRKFLQTLSAAACSDLLVQQAKAFAAVTAAAIDGAEDDLTRYVNLRVGTGGHGHTYPGATVPFGAVQLSPDTYDRGWDWCSGYHVSDRSLMGFSHTHLSGTGGGDLLDVLIIPNVGEVKWNPGTREDVEEGYRAPFSHGDEKMTPGYYSVPLHDRNVLAELTATERVGLHRYTFQSAGPSHFVLDFSHSYNDPLSPVADATLELVSNDMVTGGRTVHAWAEGRKIYFAAQFSRPFSKAQFWQEGAVLPAGGSRAAGHAIKAALHYDAASGVKFLVRVGISGVSTAYAMANLKAEMPHWDFEQTCAAAKQ